MLSTQGVHTPSLVRSLEVKAKLRQERGLRGWGPTVQLGSSEGEAAQDVQEAVPMCVSAWLVQLSVVSVSICPCISVPSVPATWGH